MVVYDREAFPSIDSQVMFVALQTVVMRTKLLEAVQARECLHLDSMASAVRAGLVIGSLSKMLVSMKMVANATQSEANRTQLVAEMLVQSADSLLEVEMTDALLEDYSM